MKKERYFEKVGLTPIVNSLKGSFSAPQNFDYKKNWQKVLQKNIYTELNGQIDLIITRNIKDFKFSKIGVMTPGNFVKTIISEN